MRIFRDKNIVLGVTGSIAAYKAASLASRLYQAGARVQVAMTRAARRFVGPLTFESLTHQPVVRDVLALGLDSEIEHVTLAKQAHLLLIAPCTAHTIARLANGLADDAVSAIALDTRAPILIAPAMETGMWENPATKENLARLKARGVAVVEPGSGHLASGAEGVGRMAEVEEVLAAARTLLAREGAWYKKRVVITAGGTAEPLDPVRVISNRSSGKMGYALAEEALERGAEVALITASEEDPIPLGVRVTRVTTTEEMCEAVLREVRGAEALIMAGAPADFRPRESELHKIKKDTSDHLTVELVRTVDILQEVARLREKEATVAPRVVVGFAAETENLLENAHAKLESKRLDLIAANPVPQTFGSDFVQATLIHADGDVIELHPMSKAELAEVILDRIAPRSRHGVP